jgi:flavin reductase (DIM6/NTAB) family NADH-FMN oxidoreductase RutF
MDIVRKIFNKINGLHYRQEYLCLAEESFQQPLHAYLIENGEILADITNVHKFVGYCPLIFALPSGFLEDSKAETIQIAFSPVKQNGFLRRKDAIAMLILKKISQQAIDENVVGFYEGVKGRHRFLSGFNQSAIDLNNRLYGKKPGNVFLKGNLYNQVQIGYAVPRKICLITVGQEGLYNQFPTDLHGQINDQYYIISLRHEGNACKQAESAGRIVLSDMELASYKKVYALGKNHMQPLKERSAFEFSSKESETFRLPLPENAVAYKELQVVSSFIWGIHKLFLLSIVHSETMQQQTGTLVHIHNCYATWRNRKGLQSNYLQR